MSGFYFIHRTSEHGTELRCPTKVLISDFGAWNRTPMSDKSAVIGVRSTDPNSVVPIIVNCRTSERGNRAPKSDN